MKNVKNKKKKGLVNLIMMTKQLLIYKNTASSNLS